MPTEWVVYEDGDYFCSLFPLEKEIHTVVHHSRSANVRLNVRELIAPMAFLGEMPITEVSLSRMKREIAAAREDLALLEEKLTLLLTELSLAVRGGVYNV